MQTIKRGTCGTRGQGRVCRQGKALRAVVESLAKMSLGDDLIRFELLSFDEAADELTDALYDLPEAQRRIVMRFLSHLTQAVLSGGGWQWMDF